MVIELTEQQAQSLVNLLDAAVRAQGLAAAAAALELYQKLQKAAQPQEQK